MSPAPHKEDLGELTWQTARGSCCSRRRSIARLRSVNRGLQAVQFQVFHRKAEDREHLTAALLCSTYTTTTVLLLPSTQARRQHLPPPPLLLLSLATTALRPSRRADTAPPRLLSPLHPTAAACSLFVNPASPCLLVSSVLLGPRAPRIHSAARQARANLNVAPAIRTHRTLVTQPAPQARRQGSSLSQNLCCPLAPFRPPNTGAKSRPGCPELLCCASSRSTAATLAQPLPTASDWPGESWHYSTLLLAPANALTSTVRESVGLPAMVGIFRRLYDWLLSLFWYVLTVIMSSFSCCLMSCSRCCRMSPRAGGGRHMGLLGRQPGLDGRCSRW